MPGSAVLFDEPANGIGSVANARANLHMLWWLLTQPTSANSRQTYVENSRNFYLSEKRLYRIISTRHLSSQNVPLARAQEKHCPARFAGVNVGEVRECGSVRENLLQMRTVLKYVPYLRIIAACTSRIIPLPPLDRRSIVPP